MDTFSQMIHLSLSKIEKPLPSEPAPKDPSSTSLGDNLLTSCALYLFFPCSHTQLSLLILPLFKLAFTLRTPSPGPVLSAELSTIIEADNSGVLKQVPNSSTPTSSPIPSSPASRIPRARQTSSFIPRLSSSSSPSITRIPIHHSHTPLLLHPNHHHQP